MVDYKKIKKSLKKALRAVEQMEMLDILMRAQSMGQLPPNMIAQFVMSEFSTAAEALEQGAGQPALPPKSVNDAPPPMGYDEWLKKLAQRQGSTPMNTPAPPSFSQPVALANSGQTDDALRQSEQRLRTIIDSTPLGIVITNEDCKIEYVNNAYAEIYGYHPSELIGQSFTIIVQPDKRDFWIDLHAKYLAGYKDIRGEWEVRHKTGKPIYILADAARITGADGRPRKVTFVSDISQLIKLKDEARQSEVQLMQAEKMSSLGQMVAGLAHEMNTPLGFVRNNLELLEAKHNEIKDLIGQYEKLRSQIMYGSPNDVAMILSQIDQTSAKVKNRLYEQSSSLFRSSIEGVDRIQDLVLNLRNFSRLDEATMKLTNINESLDSTLKIAGHLFKGGIQVVKEYGVLPSIMVSPAQMNQVFLNLITNAVQAVNEHTGKIVIRTAVQHGKVIIIIADNGKGIPPENLKRIFDPFFTTKDVGQGTGLGLSIAFKIIEKHKGTIDVQSQVGKGTEFIITLPINTDSTLAQSQPSYASPFASDSPFAE